MHGESIPLAARVGGIITVFTEAPTMLGRAGPLAGFWANGQKVVTTGTCSADLLEVERSQGLGKEYLSREGDQLAGLSSCLGQLARSRLHRRLDG